MRRLKIEMFVDDSTLSQLFETPDFGDTHRRSIPVLPPSGIVILTYQLAAAVLLDASENASLVQAAATNEDGEAYGVSSAAVVAAGNVPADSVIILPLSPPTQDIAADFTYIAASRTVFVQVHDKLQVRMTYGHCMGYSAGIGELPTEVGVLLKFPSQPNYLVAKPRLLAAIRAAVPLGQTAGPGAECAERPCIRQPVAGGGFRGACKRYVECDCRS